jgi:hypothetical protein
LSSDEQPVYVMAVPGPARPGRLGRLKASGLDLRNTWQAVAGAVLLPLGIAAIILGWNGAAHGRVDQQQIPYLISGGLLGMAVVMIGCFFYWAHWLYRIYDQADVHHQEMMRMLADVLAERRAPAGSPSGRVPSGNGAGRTFVATPTGSNFHMSGCPVLANRGANLRTVSEHEAESMKPCRICEPLAHAT